MAHGEEDLLAYYAVHVNAEGDHDFVAPVGKLWDDVPQFLIGPGVYSNLITNSQYLAKKEADQVSYAWDDLISLFTNRMLDGTSIVLPGYTYELSKSEIGVRFMALQNRYLRRGLGDAVVGALQEGRKTDKFFRVMISGPTSKQNQTGFFIMTLKYPDFLDDKGGYDQYRLVRTHFLQVYAESVLIRWPHLERVVGIGMEPPGQGRGGSEDMVYAPQREWTDADRERVQQDVDQLGIMTSLRERAYNMDEYPEVPKPPRRSAPFGNRKQRRRRAALERKSRT